MDSTTNELVSEALALLQKTGVQYTLLINDVDAGIAHYTNGRLDRLYFVEDLVENKGE